MLPLRGEVMRGGGADAALAAFGPSAPPATPSRRGPDVDRGRRLGAAGGGIVAAMPTPRGGDARLSSAGGIGVGPLGALQRQGGLSRPSTQAGTPVTSPTAAGGASAMALVRAMKRPSGGTLLDSASLAAASPSSLSSRAVAGGPPTPQSGTAPQTPTSPLRPWSSQGPRGSPQASDGEESERESVCSGMSITSTLSTMSSPSRGGGPVGGRGGRGTKSVHLSVDACSIDIEQHSSADPLKTSLCTDFKQICGEEGQAEGLLQCLQMYGYQTPNKMQRHVVPMILHFLGKQLGGRTGSVGKGKSCMVIQGPPKAGKTSSVIIGLLASLDLSLHQPQAIILSSSSKFDVDKYLRVFTLMQTVNYVSFNEAEEGDVGRPGSGPAPIDDNSPDVKAARTAHLLVGHPRRMLALLSNAPSLCLDSVKVLIVDDVEELLSAPAVFPSGPGAQERDGNTVERASSLRMADLHKARAEMPARTASPDEAPAGASASPTPPVEEVVQISNVLECRQYSFNMAGTFNIREGKEQGGSIRHVLISATLEDQTSKKVLRLLKNSLMKKKNLLAAENCPPPTKLIKSMKHYYAVAPPGEWVRVFAGLVQSLMFPRALIFCDEENIGQYYREMVDMGIAVTANLPSSGAGGNANEARRKAVQDFTANKSQFLLTHSEPAVYQIMLPKVSCVFHFGIPPSSPSVYGVRLLPLDEKVAKDAASILLVSRPSGSAPPSVVSSLGKLFQISFLDMPWEFLPATQGGRR